MYTRNGTTGWNCWLILEKQVRKFVIRREVQPKNPEKKPYTKAPKIQRLVTPQRLQRKRHIKALKRRRAEASKDAAVRFMKDLLQFQHANSSTGRICSASCQAC